ncbi:AAA family ATPase [Lutibacter sp.]|uniref:ATP-binding protein n=1 Tax=Lutibacter sp. TaxID=1925666 RepID=UPI0025BFB328|nr:AAA family ATPase [Lutibacter sp.]MCF6168489.1 AAA family ATPase [Lutibacter sp.]
MENVTQQFYEKYASMQTSNIRSFIDTIDWNNRFIGIKGSRGVGKTTLLLQYIRLNFKPNSTVLYVSLDSLYFLENKLYDLAYNFYKRGGEFLAIDEVHKYPNWAIELKNIYDNMPDLRVVFTGSSLLQLNKANADLSRRAVMYVMPGLSFREFLKFETKINFKAYTIEELLKHHIEIAIDIKQKIKPLKYFDNYLDYGYYPFYLENKESFHQKLSEILLTVLEVDIPQYAHIQTSNIIYLKKLLAVISNSTPFKPNMNSLSERTGISLNTMKLYLKLLSDAELLQLLYVENKGINSLNKPEKIFLNNSNLMKNLSLNANTGNIRETFFFNQLSKKNNVNASKNTDFYVNEKYSFEIGGKNKSRKQLKNINNSYVVKDNIEIGSNNSIPLWLFGFLY